MGRNEFIGALRGQLSGLPGDEIDAALRYYEEYLDEAENEEETIARLGSPEEIAARILAEVGAKAEAAPALPVEEKKPDEPTLPKQKRDPWQVAGLVVLCICASPLLLSLGAAALAIAIALLAVLLALLVVMIVPAFSVSAAMLALCGLLFYWAGCIMGVFTPGAVLLCGLALLFGALGIACSIFTGYLCKWSGQLIANLFRALKPKKKGAAA